MFVEKLRNILLLLNIIGIKSFETDKCKHEKLTPAVTELGKCLEEDSDAGNDHCSPFEQARNCVTDNLKDCFLGRRNRQGTRPLGRENRNGSRHDMVSLPFFNERAPFGSTNSTFMEMEDGYDASALKPLFIW